MSHPGGYVSENPVIGIRVWSHASAFPLVECVNRRDVLGGQRKVEYVKVLLHPLTMGRLRDNDVAVLDVPAKDDLRV